MANLKGRTFLLICGFCSFFSSTVSFEPISSTIAGGVVLAGMGYNFGYCLVKECCIDRHIITNFTHLTEELRANVFGQPIVQNQVVHALMAHYENIELSKKALVMSFHGTPGTGKNYVADFIAKSIYKKGLDSKFVHRFSGRTDFPIDAEVDKYRAELQEKVEAGLKLCPKSLFIFDEVDAMPSGIFDTITAFMDYNANVHGVDSRKAVFIFLSNAGGVQIAEKLRTKYKNTARDDLKLHHFEDILEVAVFNLKGGLKNAKLIEAALIDHFVPFLPLTQMHINQCIDVEFKRLRVKLTKEIRDEIMKYVTFDDDKLFSNTGCKRVTKKAEMYKRPTKKT